MSVMFRPSRGQSSVVHHPSRPQGPTPVALRRTVKALLVSLVVSLGAMAPTAFAQVSSVTTTKPPLDAPLSEARRLIAGAGHDLTLVKAAEVNRTVLEFLAIATPSPFNPHRTAS